VWVFAFEEEVPFVFIYAFVALSVIVAAFCVINFAIGF
jgi:hypothetical protein